MIFYTHLCYSSHFPSSEKKDLSGAWDSSGYGHWWQGGKQGLCKTALGHPATVWPSTACIPLAWPIVTCPPSPWLWWPMPLVQ